MHIVKTPNLPQGRVEAVLVNEKAENIADALAQRGVMVLTVPVCRMISGPVSSHADLQYHHLGGSRIAAAFPASKTSEQIKELGFRILAAQRAIGSPYPGDIGLDAARIGSLLICRLPYTDPALLDYCEKNDVQIINVRQGYAKCSVCVVDERSIITADEGIAAAAETNGIAVLRIRAGYIELPGMSCGL